MDGSLNIAEPEPQWRWRILLWASIAAAFTAWSIQYSFEHGRLIGAVGYDDVSYFCDGLDRLEEFYVHGWKGLIRTCISKPPHSPFSSTLAAASFGLFGVHDWAPYAGNVIIVFLLIAFADCLLLGARPWLRAACLALVLSVPFTQAAVCEFRPDVAVAILTAMGVVMMVMRSLTDSSLRYRLLVGVVFGLAFLVKPSICVLTGFLWCLSLGVAMTCDWYLHRPAFRKLLGIYGLTALVTIVIAAPYYAFSGKRVALYIYTNMFGSQAALWQLEATRQEHLLYYLTGQGAVEMLDNTWWILVAVMLAGVVYVLVRRDKENIVRMTALAFCMLGAYAVPTASACKHGFYGLAFHSLVLFAALLSLREIYMKEAPGRQGWRWATSVVLGVVMVLSLWQYPHVSRWGKRGDSRVGASRKTCEDLVDCVARNQQEPNSIVLTAAPARYANPHTLQWVARKEVHPLKFNSVPLEGDLEAYRDAMTKADFVIAFETDKPLKQFVSEQMAPEILAMARSMPGLVAVQSYPEADGVVYHVFKNTRTAFTSWKKTKGLGPSEGPYPQWDLPRVRWGLGEKTSLWFESSTSKPMRLSMSCRTAAKDQMIKILLDGQEIYRQPLAAQKAFTSIDVPLPETSRGEHELILEYSATDSNSDARSLSVLFERLQLVPAAD